MSLGLIKEYNEDWPNWFNQIKGILEESLWGLYLSIEHVGSTSIPGMNAKPIIDIDIIIWREKFNMVLSHLTSLGYIHIGDLGIKGREAFDLIQDKKEFLPAHHLYVCYEGEYELKKHLAFRDYLRKNKLAKEKLIKLKVELERTCKTKEEYIDKKDSLVKELTVLALKEYEEREYKKKSF